ncbi:MAG: type II and III secretion system protein, partial [Planctomycetota bacterium]|nr:type II and III secretion system protein [Planctomycetota bacterium]
AADADGDDDGADDGADDDDGGFTFGTTRGQGITRAVVPLTGAAATAAEALVVSGLRSNWELQVKALLRQGKAEVLSRPSILTLNNRQATIRVGDDIPIATSSQSSQGSFSLSFQYIPTGILLNIRPRIERGGNEVSLLIDTTVSARVPGRDLEIRDDDGNIQASAPQISTRRVQTYARIKNNTPLIIGGLISRDLDTTKDKIPFFGDLPLFGPLFRAEKTNKLRREVIIVLTPYVLPEGQDVARSLPKDEDSFDSFGNDLFRDVYRIRAEDTFDLTFLMENRRLQDSRKVAARLLQSNVRFAEREPFKSFLGGRIPGEEILVHRMTYEVIKRLDLDKEIHPSKVILFRKHEIGGFKVDFLNNLLTRFTNDKVAPRRSSRRNSKGRPIKDDSLGRGEESSTFFSSNKGKALAIEYFYDRELAKGGELLSEPVPVVSLIDCPDGDTYDQMLWEMNQRSKDGRQQYTILLRKEKDLVKLYRAMLLKHILALNGGESSATLSNFSVGKVLLVPEVKPEKIRVVDADVARYFFHIEQYYPALTQRIERTLEQLDTAVLSPKVRIYLEQLDNSDDEKK